MTKTNIKKTVYTAMFIAIGIVLPFAFHTIPNAGNMLLPMHFPVLLCGLVCGLPYGLACGMIMPLLSSVMTNMPNAVSLPGMLGELAVYGLVSALLMKLVWTKSLYADIYISLAGAMLSGRIVYGVINAFVFSVEPYSLGIWATAAFVTAIPGIVAQLVLIPIIIVALQKARLIEARY